MRFEIFQEKVSVDLIFTIDLIVQIVLLVVLLLAVVEMVSILIIINIKDSFIIEYKMLYANSMINKTRDFIRTIE